MTPLPLHKRPLDLGLCLFFSASVVYGLLISLPEGLGVPVSADSAWPPLRALHSWAVDQEPAHLDPPAILLAHALLDGFVHAPFLAVLILALARSWSWIRIPALLYGASALTNMFLYLFHTILGPQPPPNPEIYWPFNLPWLIAPVVLMLRMRAPEPFPR